MLPKKTLLILTILLSYLNTYPNILLQAPKKLSEQEIHMLAQNWITAFRWKKSLKTDIVFGYSNQIAGFTLRWFSIPCYQHNSQVLTNVYKQLQQEVSEYRKDYYFDKPMIQQNPCPKNIDFKQLVSLLKNNNFVFYTGAGLSAGKVATMYDLEKSLHIDQGMIHFFIHAYKNSNQINDAFAAFCKSSTEGLPTPAHEAIKKIAESKCCAIVTENVDLLHQRTGIKPLFAGSKEMDTLSINDLEEVKVIVCAGLSHDDRGLLSHFKKHNPNIILVALNLNTPHYLSNEDCLLQGDLQEVLPRLAQYF